MARNESALKVFTAIYVICIVIFIVICPYFRHIIKPVLCVALICVLAISRIKKLKKLIYDYEDWFVYAPFIAFAISAIISVILSKDIKHSYSVFMERYILYFLVFEIGRFLFAEKVVSDVMKQSFRVDIFELSKYTFICAALVMGIGGFIDYLRFYPARLFSVFGYTVQFLMLPLFIIYFLPIVFCLMFKNKIMFQRILAIFSFILLFMSMLFTGSRSAWIAGISSIFFVSFFFAKRNLKYLIPGVVIFTAAAYLCMPGRFHDFSSVFDRMGIMSAAVAIFRDNIFWGAGPGMYEKLLHIYSSNSIYLHAHNTYLEILAEMGIVGLITFLSIFVGFYFYIVRKILPFLKNNINKAFYIAFLSSNFGVLIFALFASIITVGFHDAPVFWLFFGMSFGLSQRISSESTQSL